MSAGTQSSPHAAAARATPTMSPMLVVVILSLLLGLQPVTTDLYLPALPSITEQFRAPVTQAQLTLSTLLLAFGTSQLVWGPLSDRFGRRPILLCGVGAYTLASVACVLATSMAMLVGWRIVQGAALGAAVMGARAIVRDLFEPEAGARAMSKAFTGLGFFACLSPSAGGLLAEHFGWRVALSAVCVVGATTFVVVAMRFEESVAARNAQALRPAMLWYTWSSILAHPAFRAWSALATASYAGLFTFLATSSFVFIQVLGLTRTQYGLVMASSAFVYVLGTFMCRRMLTRLGLKRTVAVAGGMTLAGGTALGVIAWAGPHTWWTIMGPFWVFMLGHGVHQPCGQSGAVGPFPHAAGAASALNGFLMMIAAFVVGGWVGAHLDGTVFALTNGVWFWSVCIAAVAWTLVQRHG